MSKVVAMFRYEMYEMPIWISCRSFNDEHEWNLYYQFIQTVKTICNNGYQINLESNISICDKSSIFAALNGDWDNYLNVFDLIDDQVYDLIEYIHPHDYNFFENIYALDSDIRQFSPLYSECIKCMHYIETVEKSGTYLELLPKPIFEIVEHFEYYHVMYNKIHDIFRLLCPELRNLFKWNDQLEIDEVNTVLGKIVRDYRVRKNDIKKMIVISKNES